MERQESSYYLFDENPLRGIEFDKEELSKPVLERIGIFDLNTAYDALPEKIINKIGSYPALSRFQLNLVHFDVLEKVEKSGYPIRELGIAMIDGNRFGHLMYKMEQGGLVEDIYTTSLFHRLWGIPQLGLRDDYPLPNSHNRAEHSVYTTINIARSLQTLHDKYPQQLEMRMRNDYADEPFYDPDMDYQTLLNSTANMSAVAGMIHDLGTPAGGDTIKYLLGLDEEQIVEWLLLGNHSVLLEQREQLINILQERGLTTDHLQFMMRVIQGKSSSLIGDFIHPHEGDFLDWDRVSYTLLDCEAATMFSADLPKRLLPQDLDPYTIRAIENSLSSGVDVLNSNAYMVLGVPTVDRLGENYGSPSVSSIDPSDYVKLDNEGKLVSTAPEKMAWVAASRIWMTALHYAGGKMLGLETRLQRELQRVMEQGKAKEILSMENLVQKKSSELFEELRNVGDQELTWLINELMFETNQIQFTGKIVEPEEESAYSYAEYPIKIKPGLDSLVEENGETMTLREYVERHPYHASSVWIQEGMRKFHNKKVVIERQGDRQSFRVNL